MADRVQTKNMGQFNADLEEKRRRAGQKPVMTGGQVINPSKPVPNNPIPNMIQKGQQMRQNGATNAQIRTALGNQASKYSTSDLKNMTPGAAAIIRHTRPRK